MQKSNKNVHLCVTLGNLWETLYKFLHTDNQTDNKYFISISIFIKLNVL
jgi:hypothetical protein